jgi:hypothetical protein
MRRVVWIGFACFALVLIVGLVVGKGHHNHVQPTSVANVTSTVAAPTTTTATTGPPRSLLAPGATKAEKLAIPKRPKGKLHNVDPQDYNSQLQQQEITEADQFPAAQYLPTQTKVIRADLVNTTASGQMVIDVEYTKSQAQAQRAWLAFLAQHNDSGQGYQVYYLPVKHLPHSVS